MDVLGLVIVAIFYLVILLCGLWIARKRGTLSSHNATDFILAGRGLGLTVGICSLVATEVGGAFVNGTAEEAYRRGLLWCLAPIGYSLSMSINAFVFVDKVRERKYVTLVDALQAAFGDVAGALVYLPSCIGDICWTAAVLSALGATLNVMMDADKVITVTTSATVAILYTLVGGMYSVAYTDVIQMSLTFVGLFLSLPFVLQSSSVHLAEASAVDWTGKVTTANAVSFVDTLLLIICGGISWQPYYQRALSMQTSRQVRVMSVCATALCLICMAPSVILGVAAKTVQWLPDKGRLVEDASVVLPEMIHTFAPKWVAIIALGAISAAVMSSVDSSLLSGASYVSHNIHQRLIVRRGAQSPEDEGVLVVGPHSAASLLVLRLSIVALGIVSALMSLGTDTIYGLWVLAGDLGYVIVFPHFVSAVHWPERVNAVGMVVACAVAIVLRLLIGEPLFGVPAVIPASALQFIPIKTVIMLVCLSTLLMASKVAGFCRK